DPEQFSRAWASYCRKNAEPDTPPGGPRPERPVVPGLWFRVRRVVGGGRRPGKVERMEEAKRIDDENSLIVQLPLSSFWGTEEEYKSREELADALDQLFHQDGCGVFDGTDIGEGKTNLFIVRLTDQDF